MNVTAPKERGPPRRTALKLVQWNVLVTLRSGGTKSDLHVHAGARGGLRRAPKPVRRLAALHLQSPFKHVTQNRTTSFLWSKN